MINEELYSILKIFNKLINYTISVTDWSPQYLRVYISKVKTISNLSSSSGRLKICWKWYLWRFLFRFWRFLFRKYISLWYSQSFISTKQYCVRIHKNIENSKRTTNFSHWICWFLFTYEDFYSNLKIFIQNIHITTILSLVFIYWAYCIRIYNNTENPNRTTNSIHWMYLLIMYE